MTRINSCGNDCCEERRPVSVSMARRDFQLARGEDDCGLRYNSAGSRIYLCQREQASCVKGTNG
jgi:hypothetical protein